MNDAKARVRDLLERLPEDCTLEDVIYHLYVLERIERGLAEADSGQLESHEDVERELRRRWQVDRAG